jgi:hypothetical protein
MRQQPTRPTTGRSRRRLIIIGATLFSALLAGAIVYFFAFHRHNADEAYTPPPFEPNAIAGIPEPQEHMLFTITEPEGGLFRFASVATIYRQHDDSIKLYLTNFEDNEAYIICEVINAETETVMFRSGLLRPGEYVQSLSPLIEIENKATPIHINVHAFALDDYLSVGSISLSNVLQPNNS